jgi:hypothetical protein
MIIMTMAEEGWRSISGRLYPEFFREVEAAIRIARPPLRTSRPLRRRAVSSLAGTVPISAARSASR